MRDQFSPQYKITSDLVCTPFIEIFIKAEKASEAPEFVRWLRYRLHDTPSHVISPSYTEVLLVGTDSDWKLQIDGLNYRETVGEVSFEWHATHSSHSRHKSVVLMQFISFVTHKR
jgi:hypothetical protein